MALLDVSNPPATWVLCSLTGAAALYIYKRFTSGSQLSRSLRRLPGPTPIPGIGNVLDFPQGHWYEKFTEWQKTYGDIIFLNLLGTPFLVLNSLEDAEELLNKRASNYSNRAPHVVVTDMIGFGWAILMRQPDRDFNEQRKVFRKAIGHQNLAQYDPLFERAVATLTQELGGFSGDPIQALRRAISEVILTVAYGERMYRDHGEELTNLNATHMEIMTPIFTTFYLVNIFPWLRHLPSWFPGTGVQEVVKRARVTSRRMRDWPWDMLQKDLADGTADPSIVSQSFNSADHSNNNLKEAVAMLYGAAADTTSSACDTFLYLMVTNPDAQRKVQQELDDVIERGHAITPAECQQLNYLQAAWRESMRLHPPVLLGLPHATAEEDSWKGYYIPKGTIVNANIGFMLRDPRLWGSDADAFRPERFLGPNANNLPDIGSIPFGFGKRICPGRFFADRVGIYFVASLLSVYNVSQIDGQRLPHPMPFYDDAIRHPSEFRCQFTARS